MRNGASVFSDKRKPPAKDMHPKIRCFWGAYQLVGIFNKRVQGTTKRRTAKKFLPVFAPP